MAAAATQQPSYISQEAGTGSAAAVESVSCIGQGLTSCLQVAQLQQPQQAQRLVSVCLHGNSITRIEGLSHLRNLQELNLSSNALATLDGLQGLSSLMILNLASNRLAGELRGLEGLTNLVHLNLSYNGLTGLSGLAALQGPNSKLRVLNVKHNLLNSMQPLTVLMGCPGLRELAVSGNPVCRLPNYRQALLTMLPQLSQLDELAGGSTASAGAAPLLQQLPAVNLYTPVTPPPGLMPHQLQQTMAASGRLTSPPSSTPGEGLLSGSLQPKSTPQIDLVLSGFQKRAQDQGQGMALQSYSAGPGGGGGPAVRPPANWQTGTRKSQQQQRGGEDAGGPDQSKHTASATRGGHGGDGSTMITGGTLVRKVFLMDAAVQTADTADKALRAAHKESDQLKQQLQAVAGGQVPLTVGKLCGLPSDVQSEQLV